MQLGLPLTLSSFERDCHKKIIDILMEAMGYNIANVSLWLAKESAILGGLSPIFLLNSGQSERVLQFAERCREMKEWI